MLVLAFPAYIQLARSIGSHVPGVPLREHLRAERATTVMSLRQAVFTIVILAHQSVVMLDAIARALFGKLVTRRHLLEWVTADRTDNGHASVWQVARRMWTAPAVALTITTVVAIVAPARLLLASPILVLWFISPALIYAGRTASAAQGHGGWQKRTRSPAESRAPDVAVLRRTGRSGGSLVDP